MKVITSLSLCTKSVNKITYNNPLTSNTYRMRYLNRFNYRADMNAYETLKRANHLALIVVLHRSVVIFS